MTYATIAMVQELFEPKPAQKSNNLKRVLLRWKAYQRQQRRSA
jgi:hypothetical protein